MDQPATKTQEPNANELAAVRTVLALDRTLLALVRTALTLIGFGFTLARVVHDMVKKGALPGFPSASPRQIGMALIVLGVLTVLGGVFEHVRWSNMLQSTSAGKKHSVSLMVAFAVALVGLLLLASLVVEFCADF